jgi:predicted ATP-binding protein involved in virulence
MYLRTLRLQNIKHIRDLTLSFERGEGRQPRMWTVLLGENGTGKTTILRTLALLASGYVRANQLIEADIDSLQSLHSKEEPFIEAYFLSIDPLSSPQIPIISAQRITSHTIQDSSEEKAKLVRSLHNHKSSFYDIDTFANYYAHHPSDGPFIGYGIARNIQDPKSSARPKAPPLQRLQSLFGRADLIGTNFYDHLRDESEELAAAYLATLQEVFAQILPRFKKLERGRSNEHFTLEGGSRGIKLPATWLSQGEQATVSWIADMIGWIFWDQMKAVEPKQMRAVVLIDELDLHLHPTWQRALIPALKSTFPNIQFIVTTHSPLVLSGLEPDEIIRLDLNAEGEVEQVAQHDDPRLMTSAQLLHSFFGVSKARQDGVDEKLMRYSMLVGDPGRSAREDEELRRLGRELTEVGVELDWEPVPIDPDLQREG